MLAVSGLALITLTVAIVGAVTGVASLVWQAVAFSLSGGRITVDLEVAWLGPDGALTGSPGAWRRGVAPSTDYTEECVAVHVRNVGRLPVTVTTWGVKIGPTHLSHVQSPWNKRLPHRLEVGEDATWFVGRAVVEDIVAKLRAPTSAGTPLVQEVVVRGSASLGTGKTVESKVFIAATDPPSLAERDHGSLLGLARPRGVKR